MAISPKSYSAFQEACLRCSSLPVWSIKKRRSRFPSWESFSFLLCRPKEAVRFPAIFADGRDGQTNRGEMSPASRGASATRILVAKRSATGNRHEPHRIQRGPPSSGPGATSGYSELHVRRGERGGQARQRACASNCLWWVQFAENVLRMWFHGP